jgi:hypothetical protein
VWEAAGIPPSIFSLTEQYIASASEKEMGDFVATGDHHSGIVGIDGQSVVKQLSLINCYAFLFFFLLFFL